LHFAAFQGNHRLAEFLLEHGASTESRSRDGLTPLEVANPSIFDLLLEASFANNAPADSLLPSGAKKDILNRLPTISFEHGCMDCAQCHICLEEFEDGDQLRALPCSHYFHVSCVDAWLGNKSSTCPVCRTSV
jgi:hypothetical protein